MKESLQSSKWLQEELKNYGLQQIITQIVTSSSKRNNFGNTNNYNHRLINKKHRNNKMEKTLEYYLEQNLQFKQFVDKLHVLTGTLQIKEKVDDDENPTMIRRLQPSQRKQPHQQKMD